MTVTLDDIRQARDNVAGIAWRTPLVRLEMPGAPAEIWLKLECLQPIGSFKIRGAANAMARIPRVALERGVFTASAGNMAQGVAWCARQREIPCTAIAPDTAPDTKIRAIERLGSRVLRVSFERWWQVYQDREYPGIDGTFIHAFDDPDVMAGNGTIGLEVLEDLPDADAIVVPWGGGGLCCGIASAARAIRPSCRMYAAEVTTAAPLAPSLAAGVPQSVDYRPSFVDGIGSRTVLPQMLNRARFLLDGALVATPAEVAAAIATLAERAHVVAEGAGACPVACALSGRAGSGKIVCIVSGGNIDRDAYLRALRGETP